MIDDLLARLRDPARATDRQDRLDAADEIERLLAANRVSLDNCRNARSAMELIREAIEEQRPGLLVSGEHLPDPEFTTEAETFVAAIHVIGGPSKA